MGSLNNTQNCPLDNTSRVILSKSSDYWDGIKINPYAPSANLRPVTKPNTVADGKRIEPWFSPDENLAEASSIRWSRYNNETSRVLHTGNDKHYRSVYRAASQLLELQSVDLAANFPEVYEINDNPALDRTITNKVAKNIFPIHPSTSNLHPLAISGLLGQEDICIVKETKKGRYVMIGGFLATPTEWDLENFIGSDMDEIHQYVNGYDAPASDGPIKVRLKDTVDRALKSLPEYPTRQIMRNNLFLKKNGSLALVPGEQNIIATKEISDPGTQLFLRSERETLTRLPSTEQYPDGNRYVIFTILANVINLSQAAASTRKGEYIRALQTNNVLQIDKKLAKIALKFLNSQT